MDTLAGVALGMLAILVALSFARGTLRLGSAVSLESERVLGARWALDRLAREAARAGYGVCPGGEPDCPDEEIEFIGPGAVFVRGDLDGDDPALARDPEADLAGHFAAVPTGNGEVVGYLLRPGSGRTDRVLFDADLDSTDRTTRADGTTIARRDGAVESIDAGPAAGGDEAPRGTLYRVSFTDDARWFGTGRFRVSEPLVDNAVQFRVDAFDAAGAPVGGCGGADDAASRACRARVRRLAVPLVLADDRGRQTRLGREVDLGARGAP